MRETYATPEAWKAAHPKAFPKTPVVSFAEASHTWDALLQDIFKDLFERIAQTDEQKQTIRDDILKMLEEAA